MIDAGEMFPMNWRFFPSLDPQVDIFLSRDLDSRFGDRELAAVQEWLHSDYAFHFMRDHPLHNVTVLGSTWGSKLTNTQIRSNWREAWKKGIKDDILWAPRQSWGPDQKFLDKYVWPWAKANCISHDSFYCEFYPNTRAFPTQRLYESMNFLSSRITSNGTHWWPGDRLLWRECPEKCRPPHHPNWKHC